MYESQYLSPLTRRAVRPPDLQNNLLGTATLELNGVDPYDLGSLDHIAESRTQIPISLLNDNDPEIFILGFYGLYLTEDSGEHVRRVDIDRKNPVTALAYVVGDQGSTVAYNGSSTQI